MKFSNIPNNCFWGGSHRRDKTPRTMVIDVDSSSIASTALLELFYSVLRSTTQGAPPQFAVLCPKRITWRLCWTHPMISHIAPRCSNALVTHQFHLLHCSILVYSNRTELFAFNFPDDLRHSWNFIAFKFTQIGRIHARQTPWVRLALCSKRSLEKKLSGLQVDEKRVIGKRKFNFVKLDS